MLDIADIVLTLSSLRMALENKSTLRWRLLLLLSILPYLDIQL